MKHSSRQFVSIAVIALMCLFPVVVGAQSGWIQTSGCEVPGADPGNCRNVEILLVQAIFVIEKLFGLLGTLAFAMFVYGGVKMILSFGSEDKFSEGKEAMVNAVIGMFIAFSAYVLVNFVLDVLGVNDDFRAVGSSSQVETSTGEVGGTTCQTSDQCGEQTVCRESRCVDLCGAAEGQCGVWDTTSCASPKTIQSNLCPSPNGNTDWKCCALPPETP